MILPEVRGDMLRELYPSQAWVLYHGVMALVYHLTYDRWRDAGFTMLSMQMEDERRVKLGIPSIFD